MINYSKEYVNFIKRFVIASKEKNIFSKLCCEHIKQLNKKYIPLSNAQNAQFIDELLKIKESPVDVPILHIDVKDFFINLCQDNNLDFDEYWQLCQNFIDKNSNKNIYKKE